MPLPDAKPDPEKASVYNQLNTKVILPPQNNFLTDTRPENVLTQSQFQTIKAPVHIQGSNEDELRRLNLIGITANQSSNSGPFRIINVEGVLTGTGFAKMQPDLPGMYQLCAVDATVSGGSGTQTYEMCYGDINDDCLCKFFYMESTDSGVIFTADGNYPAMPMFFSDQIWLTCRLSSVGGGITNVTFSAIFAQYR